ncbi:protein ABHD11-like [Argiope bruennichi]|uniref:sn-1-specific diacylglycerol lipase ABHD11 n=1 Tax=Argiope bruennichi TaxID=94029 RepID=A0A8T0EKH9_ARGBR|nr:protein ABHD11-like [Argiope bruennichi]KAF8774460.1 Protein ABHD11 like protein [Argiope bruennichi]
MDSENKPTPVDLFFTSYEPSDKLKNTESKPPIIFIHGLLATPNCWHKVKSRIADSTGRKVYAIGMRNHGSNGWSDEFTVEHLVADLDHFMAKQNIPKAILVAHSLGGRAAIRFTLLKPEMVEKLIIVDMTISVDEEQYEETQQFRSILIMAKNSLEEIPPSFSEAAAQKKLQQLFSLAWCKKSENKTSRPPKIPLPFHKDKSNKFVWDFNIDAVINSLASAHNFQTDLSEDSVYLVEALFISGEYSTIPILKDKDVIQKRFPNSKIVVAKDVYHNYHLEKPDEFVNEIIQFIGRKNIISVL